jgi:transcriptional regulator with XRE-family HTH domain
VARPVGTTKIKFDPEKLELLERMAAVGMTVEQMANILGISHDTLQRYEKNDPEVNACIKRGRDNAIFEIAAVAFQAAKNPDNTADRCFWLKTRARWTEKSEIDMNVRGAPIIIHRPSDGSAEILTTEDDKPDANRNSGDRRR